MTYHSLFSRPSGTINTGLVFGFSAVLIPQLKAEGSEIQINDSQSSWIGKSSIKIYCATVIIIIIINSNKPSCEFHFTKIYTKMREV